MGSLLWRLLRYLARRLRPDFGWLGLAALALCGLSLVTVLVDTGWAPRAHLLSVQMVLALAGGWALIRWVRSPRLAATLATVAGAALSLLLAAGAWPPWPILWGNLRYAVSLLPWTEPAALSTIPLDAWLAARFQEFFATLAAWQRVLAAGGTPAAREPLLLGLLLVVWAVMVWAVWVASRQRRALLALAPCGAALALSSFYAYAGYLWLGAYMAGLLLLALHLRQITLRQEWEEGGFDYSPEISLELYAFGAGLIVAIVALMPFTPNLRIAAIERAFYQAFAEPITAVEEARTRLLPGDDRARAQATAALTAGGLPRSHLLGSGPELSQQVVMTVRASGQAAAPQAASLRWRAITFATYTGRGWTNPAGLETSSFAAGETWASAASAGRQPLRQQVAFAAGPSHWLYAAGDPVAADRAVRAFLRSPEDVVGLEVRAQRYMVVSQTPLRDEAGLRAVAPSAVSAVGEGWTDQTSQTGQTYAPEDGADFLQPYLELPPELPQRVANLAWEIVGGADNAYDQVQALERFLRQYEYTLQAPPPPPEVDVADYFLFTARQGYCDYYATALVVMARSLGLPARLAVGYASGHYDAAAGHYVVTEADAHSWPEVYFEAYGWIPFEPTAAQPLIAPAPAQVAPDPAAGPQRLDLAQELQALRRRALRQTLARWAGPPLAGVVALLAALWLRRGLRLRRQAANAWQMTYLQLEGWGSRLGVLPAAALTPREYAGHWRSWLAQAGAPTALVQAAGATISELSLQLERRSYAPPAARPDDGQARALARRLHWLLWRLRVAAGLSALLSRPARKRRNP